MREMKGGRVLQISTYACSQCNLRRRKMLPRTLLEKSLISGDREITSVSPNARSGRFAGP